MSNLRCPACGAAPGVICRKIDCAANLARPVPPGDEIGRLIAIVKPTLHPRSDVAQLIAELERLRAERDLAAAAGYAVCKGETP